VDVEQKDVRGVFGAGDHAVAAIGDGCDALEATHVFQNRDDGVVFDVGVVVDGVSEVLRVDFDEEDLTAGGKRHTRSLTVEARARTQGRYAIMMHLDQVLSADEIAELSRVSETLDFCCTH
jgi:chemotaxis signal transduction protein